MVSPMSSMTVEVIRKMKGRRKIVSVTAVDYPTALWCREAGIDIVLIGDSLGMVSFGMRDTTEVTEDMMIRATRAAARALKDAKVGKSIPLLVSDFPLCGFGNPRECADELCNAGADAVKIECHEVGMAAIAEIREAGREVMAHVGLLPQEVKKLGGYPLQGATPEEEARVIETALRAEELGAFSCVVEKVPQALGRKLTERLSIPTIGIGAGPDCDGQILVQYDLLGIFEEFRPKFVRRYAEIGVQAVRALKTYADDVRAGTFPSDAESFQS